MPPFPSLLKTSSSPTEPMIQRNFPVIHSEVQAHSGSQLFCIHEAFPKCTLANFNVFYSKEFPTPCAIWKPIEGLRMALQQGGLASSQHASEDSHGNASLQKTWKTCQKTNHRNIGKHNAEMLQVFLVEPLSLVIHE